MSVRMTGEIECHDSEAMLKTVQDLFGDRAAVREKGPNNISVVTGCTCRDLQIKEKGDGVWDVVWDQDDTRKFMNAMGKQHGTIDGIIKQHTLLKSLKAKGTKKWKVHEDALDNGVIRLTMKRKVN